MKTVFGSGFVKAFFVNLWLKRGRKDVLSCSLILHGSHIPPFKRNIYLSIFHKKNILG